MRKLVLVLLLLLFPAVGWAGEYVLEKGKRVEVCEEYGKHLHLVNPVNPARLYTRHEQKFNSQFKDFNKPEWEKYFGSNNELFDKVDLFLWESDANPAYHNDVVEGKNLRNSKKQRAGAWKRYKAMRQAILVLGLPISKTDIDNDGKIENVIFDSVNSEILLVLNDDKTDIDFKKTELILQHPRLPPDLVGDSIHAVYYDVDVYYDMFIYKQKTYFDFWNSTAPSKGIVRVFIIENQKTEEICTYNYSD